MTSKDAVKTLSSGAGSTLTRFVMKAAKVGEYLGASWGVILFSCIQCLDR
jgi:hypothetical protein